MEYRTWRIGDLCYIADAHIEPGRMRFRVMPARIVHIAGVVRPMATAQSVNRHSTTLFGWEPFTEGRPFVNTWAAFAEVWRQMRRNRISLLVPISFEGKLPEMKNLSADIPRIGQIVYGINIEQREVFEAQVGYLRYEFGKVSIGYDQSPGNPEASNVRITKWWSSRQEADRYIAETLKWENWAFVSREELAARTDDEIERIWSDAVERVRSPQFQGLLGGLGESLAQS